jgi:hypothetical protein
MVPLEEALRLREIIEKERAAAGKSHEPLDYFIRPQSPDAAEVARFTREGFDNIVLWGPHVWPNSGALSLADKVAGLTRVARDLGLSPDARAA